MMADGRTVARAHPVVPSRACDRVLCQVLFATGTGARMYRAEARALLRRLSRAAGFPNGSAGRHRGGARPLLMASACALAVT
jgi:hypothetical protein